MRRDILIIEHDRDAGARMAAALTAADYACRLVSSDREGLAMSEREPADLVVLDASLPGASGENMICLLRAAGLVPVIVVCGRGEEEAVVELLASGADDYLLRPFDMDELVARISVQLLRFAGAKRPSLLRYRDLTLNPVTFSATLCGQPLGLTRQEYRILELMLSFPPGRVFTRQDFFNYAWDDCYVGVDKTVSVHICNIRRKMRCVTPEAYIETVRSFGFKLA